LARKKECLDKHGIYSDSFRAFEKELKANFVKRQDLFTATRLRQITGRHPAQIKNYVEAAVELKIIHPVPAYYRGCPLTKLIIVNSLIGTIAICPSCNSEIIFSEGQHIVCDCGINYVKHESEWLYEPRSTYEGKGVWKLESLSIPGDFYTINLFDEECSCYRREKLGVYCKHLKKAARLTAIIMYSRRNNLTSSSNEDLAVLTAVFRRRFDLRKYVNSVTYRELKNDLEKINGLVFTTNKIAHIVSRLKIFLNKTKSQDNKILINVNERALEEFRKLENTNWQNPLPEITNNIHNEAPFLKLDRISNESIMLPFSDFSFCININYKLSDLTHIRIDVQDLESEEVTCSLTVRLKGEDIASFRLTPHPICREEWIPQVELYSLNDKNEWTLADHLLSQKVYSPILIISKIGDGLYKIQSFSEEGKFYIVDVFKKQCSCPDYVYNHNYCKHLQAIEKFEIKEGKADSLGI
jgi:hypothetical protein